MKSSKFRTASDYHTLWAQLKLKTLATSPQFENLASLDPDTYKLPPSPELLAKQTLWKERWSQRRPVKQSPSFMNLPELEQATTPPKA